MHEAHLFWFFRWPDHGHPASVSIELKQRLLTHVHSIAYTLIPLLSEVQYRWPAPRTRYKITPLQIFFLLFPSYSLLLFLPTAPPLVTWPQPQSESHYASDR
ncbi:hypothetical protein BCR43DRAFT_19182 [Syncephalastrum racemosum]|uniref:Uncharacterized protein n=1 Tax=Syncephalastrum racemosum TaxID=13706 RepID=A0A1X2HT59_SYNRA|nr:hypothetical protein BCR43DRAFT_19182 [Syncephalastrum racemosum]